MSAPENQDQNPKQSYAQANLELRRRLMLAEEGEEALRAWDKKVAEAAATYQAVETADLDHGPDDELLHAGWGTLITRRQARESREQRKLHENIRPMTLEEAGAMIPEHLRPRSRPSAND